MHFVKKNWRDKILKNSLLWERKRIYELRLCSYIGHWRDGSEGMHLVWMQKHCFPEDIFVSNRLLSTYFHKAHKFVNQRKRDGTFRTLMCLLFDTF